MGSPWPLKQSLPILGRLKIIVGCRVGREVYAGRADGNAVVVQSGLSAASDAFCHSGIVYHLRNTINSDPAETGQMARCFLEAFCGHQHLILSARFRGLAWIKNSTPPTLWSSSIKAHSMADCTKN
jgi:hypothetical protein